MEKVVILAGGKGSRLQELTGENPKPMLLVGGTPIIRHIINHFAADGFKEFIIATGYLSNQLNHYFRMTFVVREEHDGELVVTGTAPDGGELSITLVNTGNDTMTGGRLARLESYLTEPFMLTYGDGMSNVHPKYVRDRGVELQKNIVTVVHPVPRFGEVKISPDQEVISFNEKVTNSNEWINGGFFYLRPEIFNYFPDDSDMVVFEKDILPKVVWNSGLYAFPYEGIWHCIDTLRDLTEANRMWYAGEFK